MKNYINLLLLFSIFSTYSNQLLPAQQSEQRDIKDKIASFQGKIDEQKELIQPSNDQKEEKISEVSGIASLIVKLYDHKKSIMEKCKTKIKEIQTEGKDYEQAKKEVENLIYLLTFPKGEEIEYEEAGVNGTKTLTPKLFYTDGNVGLLHEQGHILDPYELADIFFGATIWNFYIYKCLDFLPTLVAYDKIQEGKLSALQKENCDSLAKRFGLSELSFDTQEDNSYVCINNDACKAFIFLTQAINNLLQAFARNSLFVKLGVAYQRWKVVMEKIDTESSSDKVKQLRTATDSFTTDLQIMICHFIKEACETFIQKYKDTKTTLGKLSIGTVFFDTFQPSFINKPYYKYIVAKIDNLIQPLWNNDTDPRDRQFGGLPFYVLHQKFITPEKLKGIREAAIKRRKELSKSE